MAAAKRAASSDRTARAGAKRAWLGKRAWQDVRRACDIGHQKDAYSVELHGVRYVFRRQDCVHLLESKKKPKVSKEHKSQPKASGSPRAAEQPLNSRQRRSAARMREFNAKKAAASSAGNAAGKTAAVPAATPAADDGEAAGNQAREPARTCAAQPAGQSRETTPMELDRRMMPPPPARSARGNGGGRGRGGERSR